ncbi:uncharacterized protein LOC144130129 isoform X1 [Amblyomma americanum]
MIRGKLLAIATTLLGVAFGMPTYNEVFGIKIATEYCPGPYPPDVPVDVCWCLVYDKLPRNYKDGTSCHIKAPGYNKELTWKGGYCYQGKCRLHHIPKGCRGEQPPDTTNNIPVGCAYICTNQAKNRSEYGYYHLGTECKHLMKDGAYVLGTCKSIKNNGTICVPYYN